MKDIQKVARVFLCEKCLWSAVEATKEPAEKHKSHPWFTPGTRGYLIKYGMWLNTAEILSKLGTFLSRKI